MRVLRWLAMAMSGLLISGVLLAQDTACPALVEQALQASDKACSALGRNQICYGNIKAQAFDRDGGALSFKVAGDKLAVQDVSKLITFPMNVTEKTWGVAMLSLQANLPDTLPGQSVAMVAFGDVSLENEVKADAPPAPSLTAVATGKINVRTGAGTSFDLAGTLKQGDPVTAIGRNEKGDWIQVSFDKGTGWIFSSLLKFKGDSKTLLPTDGAIAYNAPMQAFTFHTNPNGLSCTEAPENGLLIQSPQHVAVNFRVNGIEIKVGSTALVRSAPNDTVRILNLEGSVVASPATSGVPLLPGQLVEAHAGDVPGDVQVYTADDVRALPLNLLPDAITLAPVITEIQTHTVVANGIVNLFPLFFVNGDGDAIVAVQQTLISATSGTWFSGRIAVSPGDYTNSTDGELAYQFSCSGITRAITVVYELALIDAAGNSSPPARYTAICSPT